MANRLLEQPPRNEQEIIRDAVRSGMFLHSAASTGAALLKHVQQMETNAEVRRASEAAQMTQMDYDRKCLIHCKAELHHCVPLITR